LILSVLFGALGNYFTDKVLNVPLAGMAVSMMAPAMFFFILTGIFRGYFQGNGTKMPAMHSQILNILFLFAGGLIGATLLHKYGVKVSAFLQNEDYAAAYGAMGASIGLLAASFFCFLHVLILFFVFKSSLKKQMGRELLRNQDTTMRVLYLLIRSSLLYSLYWVCFHGMPLFDQYLFFSFNAEMDSRVTQWGQYYGKCLVVIGIVCGLANVVCMIPVRRIMVSLEREENRIARERLGILIHQCAVIVIPAAVFMAVLAENVLDMFFKGNQQDAVSWVQLGSVIIVFYVFASVFMEILMKSRKMKYVTGMGAIALILHSGIAVLLLKTAKTGITGVITSVIVFYAAVAVLGFLLICRSFQYRQEWIRSFAITAAASAVSGVIALLLNKVFAPLVGSVISLVICLVTAVIIYLVLLIVLRAFKDGELEEMAGGRILMMLAGLLHFT
ncbi:MAG: polysaccharide biosynthesis C-terminal domain-containing protein, partial [Lachnospiraceae bacterium]|nr:polysaccharide biosynthesis C-terminal domain-containing protein [Lachnospiraceae bacterium]